MRPAFGAGRFHGPGCVKHYAVRKGVRRIGAAGAGPPAAPESFTSRGETGRMFRIRSAAVRGEKDGPALSVLPLPPMGRPIFPL